MPYTADNLPATIESLPKEAQAIWMSVFNSAFRAFEGNDDIKDEVGRKAAWAAVKTRFHKTDAGKWVANDGKRTFIADNRIVVEMNLGIDGYTGGSSRWLDQGAGISILEGSNPDNAGKEAAALFFDRNGGWTVGKAIAWARRWAAAHQSKVKRIGVEFDEEDDDALIAQRIVPFHKGWLKKAVDDPALARNRVAFAEVMVPWEVDTQGDCATPEEIERASHRFMEKQAIGIEHVRWDDVGFPVENFIARDGDPDFAPGAWVMGVKFSADAWQHVLNDELSGLSIGGMWERVPMIEEEALPRTGTHG